MLKIYKCIGQFGQSEKDSTEMRAKQLTCRFLICAFFLFSPKPNIQTTDKR